MSQGATTGQDKRKSSAFLWTVGGLVTVLLTICIVLYIMQPVRLETAHGRRIGLGETSVNGTAALSAMFESAGHRVFTWRRLSSKLDVAKTIVWFPDSFKPPNAEEREFLERWLNEDSDRTLVYVGRDFTAAPEYWRSMQDVVEPAQYHEYVRREARALATHNVDRADMPEEEYARWFTVRRATDRHVAKSLTSSDGWLDDVNVERTNIVLQGDFAVPQEDDVIQQRKAVKAAGSEETVEDLLKYEVLLAANQSPVVMRASRPRWGSSQVIVVTNGSFLLNLPLVNEEHRKLAGKLIAACGAPDQVAFLETGPDGAFIFEESGETSPNGLEVFTVWPMSAVSLHFAAVGIITCFLLWPIFGRAREGERETASDFYKHIVAMGAMLERTRDETYARQRIAHYYQATHRDRSSTKGPSTPLPSPATQLNYNLPHEATPQNATKLAEHAVFLCANEHEISLDFTPESVKLVDNLLTSLHASNRANESAAQTLAFCLGVYVGEILVRHHQGVWHDRSEDPLYAQVGPYMIVELRSIRVTGDAQQMLMNPIGKAMMQLESGVTNSVELYYQELVRTHQANSV